jgi:hypothetical protein
MILKVGWNHLVDQMGNKKYSILAFAKRLNLKIKSHNPEAVQGTFCLRPVYTINENFVAGRCSMSLATQSKTKRLIV